MEVSQVLPDLQCLSSQDLEKLHDLRRKAHELMPLVDWEKAKGRIPPPFGGNPLLPDDLLDPAERNAFL
jgi:hypothetical protein